jgi:hypothetical protein
VDERRDRGFHGGSAMLDSAFNERLHLNPLFSLIAVDVGQRHPRKQRCESDDQALNHYKDDQERIFDL